MFMVLCYQAAGLRPYVDACSTFNGDDWVSNKHGVLLDYQLDDGVSMSNFNLYIKYLVAEYGTDHLNIDIQATGTVATPTSPRTGKNYKTPLSVWTGGHIQSFDFAGKFTRAMCVDAKRIRATELLARCSMDKEGWEYIGFFSWNNDGSVEPRTADGQPARLIPSNYQG
jgi:hypothetical protein